VTGRLGPAKATAGELRGEQVFFGKDKCASCHTPPAYLDQTLEDTVEFFNLVLRLTAHPTGEAGTGRLHGAVVSGASTYPRLKSMSAILPDKAESVTISLN